MTRWTCGTATRRSALSSETVGGGVLLAFPFETEQFSMAEDRYLLFFPNLRLNAAEKSACGSWIGPDQMLSGICKKPEFLFELWTLLAWFLGIGAEVWRDRDPA